MNQLKTEIVVIGGGAGGLAAAVTAAESGASVIVLEKTAATGGQANGAAGPFAVESRLQRMKTLQPTREEAFKTWMDFAHWRPDARLVKAYIDKSGSTIDWLENMGVEFEEPQAYFAGGYLVWIPIKATSNKSRGGRSMIKVLTNRARDLGVKIFLKTPAKQILKEGGRIAGVIAEDKSTGESLSIDAEAAIISTGGFRDNGEWMKKFTEWQRKVNNPIFLGEGIRMAWDIGAAESDILAKVSGSLDIPFHAFYGPGNTVLPEFPKINFGIFRQPNIMVNLLGERFVNEELTANYPFLGHAIARQKKQLAFMIFDEGTRKHYEEEGFDCSMPGSSGKYENLEANIKKAQDLGYSHLFSAESIEEICAKTGIDLNGLQKTISKFNNACETGRDELFYRNPRFLRPIKQPKFYAARFHAGVRDCLGGIKINYKTEVLTKNHEVIPGLYAAGTDANALYGDAYPYELAGTMLGFALTGGQIAGENAVSYIRSKDT